MWSVSYASLFWFVLGVWFYWVFLEKNLLAWHLWIPWGLGYLIPSWSWSYAWGGWVYLGLIGSRVLLLVLLRKFCDPYKYKLWVVPFLWTGWTLLLLIGPTGVLLDSPVTALPSWGLHFGFVTGLVFLVSIVALVALKLRGETPSALSRLIVILVGLAYFRSYQASQVLLTESMMQDPGSVIGLLQTDWPMEEKWNSDLASRQEEEVALKVRRLAEAGAKVIVTPETCSTGVPLLCSVRRSRFWSRLARELKVTLILGTVDGPKKNNYYNCAWVIGPDGSYLYRYDKSALIPYFESHYLQGDLGNLPGSEVRLAICLESVHGENLWSAPRSYSINLLNEAGFLSSAPLIRMRACLKFLAISRKEASVWSSNKGSVGGIATSGSPERFKAVDISGKLVKIRHSLTTLSRGSFK